MWRSMTNRSLGTIGLLNFGPDRAPSSFLFGLRGAGRRGQAAAAGATRRLVGAGRRRRRQPRAQDQRWRPRPHGASRAMNFERTSTTPSGCPRRHPRTTDSPAARGGTSPVLARTSATISATRRAADSSSSSAETVPGSRPARASRGVRQRRPPPREERSPETSKPRVGIELRSPRGPLVRTGQRWCSGSAAALARLPRQQVLGEVAADPHARGRGRRSRRRCWLTSRSVSIWTMPRAVFTDSVGHVVRVGVQAEHLGEVAPVQVGRLPGPGDQQHVHPLRGTSGVHRSQDPGEVPGAHAELGAAGGPAVPSRRRGLAAAVLHRLLPAGRDHARRVARGDDEVDLGVGAGRDRGEACLRAGAAEELVGQQHAAVVGAPSSTSRCQAPGASGCRCGRAAAPEVQGRPEVLAVPEAGDEHAFGRAAVAVGPQTTCWR